VITSDQLASSDGSCFKLLTLASILLCRLPGRTNHLCAKCRGKAYLLSQQTVREIVDAVLKGNKPQVSSGRKRFDSLAPRTPFRSTFMAWPQRSLRLLARPCLTSQCVRPLTQTTRLRPAAWCASPTPFMQQRRTCTRSSMQLGRLTLDGEHMSYPYFLELWRRYFWHVRCRKWICFAKCSTCTQLRYG
jgi:hypothetical protein